MLNRRFNLVASVVELRRRTLVKLWDLLSILGSIWVDIYIPIFVLWLLNTTIDLPVAYDCNIKVSYLFKVKIYVN